MKQLKTKSVSSPKGKQFVFLQELFNDLGEAQRHLIILNDKYQDVEVAMNIINRVRDKIFCEAMDM